MPSYEQSDFRFFREVFQIRKYQKRFIDFLSSVRKMFDSNLCWQILLHYKVVLNLKLRMCDE